MKKLLTVCGYNHPWVYKDVTNDKVKKLEEFIETRYRKLADEFEEYKEIKPFTFLPGHRDLIFAVQAQFKSLQNTQRAQPPMKPSKRKNAVPNDDELKMMLIDQLTSYSVNKLSLKLDWSKSIQELQSFEISSENAKHITAQCSVLCPVCETSRITRYGGKYWRISNMTRHVQSHHPNNSTNNSNLQSSSSSSQQTSQETKKRAGSNNICNKGTKKSKLDTQFDLESAEELHGLLQEISVANELNVFAMNENIDEDSLIDSLIEYDENEISVGSNCSISVAQN